MTQTNQKRTDKIIVVAGTFDMFHIGHKELLNKAHETTTEYEDDELYNCYIMIGVTSDQYASKKSHDVEPYRHRVASVINYMINNCCMDLKDIEIVSIDSQYTNDLCMSEKYSDIIVSDESFDTLIQLQHMRKYHNAKELRQHIVPLKYNENGVRVSSTRIRLGEMDRDGNTITKKK